MNTSTTPILTAITSLTPAEKCYQNHLRGSRAWYVRNKEKVSQRMSKWYLANKTALQAYKRNWYLKKKEASTQGKKMITTTEKLENLTV